MNGWMNEDEWMIKPVRSSYEGLALADGGCDLSCYSKIGWMDGWIYE